ncbi:MAG TPA: RNA-binding domain-containing protein [Fimbriimonadaceae bacterium]|nr:RNA-binding domain-containing protein [Fimbriimonadaceae bacterium]
MADLKGLVAAVHDSDSLCDLLRALDWPVLQEFAFQDQPEIAQGVKGASCRVQSLIPASADDPRLFLLVEFHGHYVRRDLREVLASLRRYTRDTAKWHGKTGTGDTIFVVASPGYEDVRFVLFEEQDRRLPRIRSFGWRHEFIGRTVLTHNLERLRWGQSWEQAWDVEGLTEQFYKDYEETFANVLSQVQGAPDEKTMHSWTQLLFNRLLFLAFIQRMGWLRMPTGSHDGFLYDLYRMPDRGPFKTVYGMLRAVFAELDTQEDHSHKNRYSVTIGKVPYLNGGLFDQDDPLDRPDISVPDAALGLVLAEPHGLFARYNFTVTESTPLDQEVAVDPEMLGKIFERLIIAEERHQTGTYYTPRPIVEFMVNEALKGYLVDRGLAPEKAALLVDEDKTKNENKTTVFDSDDLQNTADWLAEVRAVDPACGSGAYLLMLLQRLFELVDRVQIISKADIRDEHSQKRLYNLKLRLLQRCIYGVDLNETAVRIARLRMWLSLVVENKGEKPEPLPNFDFLIMQGDALASPLFPTQLVLGYPDAEVREYTRLKRRYFHPEPGERRPTREEMGKQREKIEEAFVTELTSPLRQESAKRFGPRAPFDWEVEFAEVFSPFDSEETLGGRLNLGPAGSRGGQGELPTRAKRPAGFDIVVANPPYVNSGELRVSAGEAYKAALVKAYPNSGTGMADLLVFFVDRFIQLLRPGGQFAVITSNKWLRTQYGRKIRTHLPSVATICDIVDFHDGKVFQNADAYPVITVGFRQRAIRGPRYTSVPLPQRHTQDPDINRLRDAFGVQLDLGAFRQDGEWNLQAADPTPASTRVETLDQYVGERVFHGIQTSLNEVKVDKSGRQYGKGEKAPPGASSEGVFIISAQKRFELLGQDPLSADLIKPVLMGRDVGRWLPHKDDRYMIVTPVGVDISRYPAVKRHLDRYQAKLQSRREKGNFYWELRPCKYYHLFEKESIVYVRFQVGPRFALKPAGTYANDACFLLDVGRDLFLLAVLNSSTGWSEIERVCTKIQNGRQLLWDQFKRVRVPKASPLERQRISELVERILTLRAAEETDRLVEELRSGTSDNIDVTTIRSLHGEIKIPQQIAELEAQIDRRVEFLYFHQDEAPTYDEWLAKREAEKGTAAEAVRKLIASDESGTVEFKETLEFVDRVPDSIAENLRDGWKANKRRECVEGVLKTICAFTNSKGGTLLIGVSDGKEIVGLAPDFKMLGQKQNRDGFENKLKELLKRIRPLPTDLDIDFPELDGKTICRIQTPASSVPHYLDNRLFVRFGNASEELTGRDLQDWLEKRG